MHLVTSAQLEAWYTRVLRRASTQNILRFQDNINAKKRSVGFLFEPGHANAASTSTSTSTHAADGAASSLRNMPLLPDNDCLTRRVQNELVREAELDAAEETRVKKAQTSRRPRLARPRSEKRVKSVVKQMRGDNASGARLKRHTHTSLRAVL